MKNSKMLKRVTSILFCVALVLSGLVVPADVVRAEEDLSGTLTLNGIKYELYSSSGTAYVYDVVDDSMTKIEIPSVITDENGKEYTVSKICDGAFFKYNTSVVITLPATIKVIDEQAFYYSVGLTAINIPEGVTTIGYSAFAGCSNLKEITIPGTVQTVGDSAFRECTSLESVVLEEGITSLGENVFYGCQAIKEVTIPSSVTTFGQYVFSWCSGMEKVTMNGGSAVPYGMFYYCKSLTEIAIPEGVSSLGDYSFDGCEALTTVTLPTTLTAIGENVFASCEALNAVFYPEAIQDIVEAADIPDETVKASYAENEDGTVSIKVDAVPEGVESIQLPDAIGGKEITSVEVDESEADVNLLCKKHVGNRYGYDVENHWFSSCTICGTKKVEPASHSYENGNTPCICGYAPFTLAGQVSDVRVSYGSTESAKLSVNAVPTMGSETLTYQWYQNGAIISGTNASGYTLPSKMPAGNYSYTCKIASGDYVVETKAISVEVVPKNITVQIDAKEKVEGEDNPAFTYTIVRGALAEGDSMDSWTVNLTTTATKESVAGTYDITGTITAANYAITVNPGVLTIKEAPKAKEEEKAPKKGAKIKDAKKLAYYKVTKVGTKAGKVGTVEYIKPVNKKKKTVSIPSTITVDGIKYKVTGIASNAFKNNKYVTKVTIGKNVTTIKSKAFYGCKKLKTLIIKTTKLSIKKIGSKAFSKTPKTMTVKVPKKKYKSYKSMLVKRGVNKKAKFKKI